MATVDQLPDYAPLLADFHRAFSSELRAAIATLPLSQGDRVLDVACGDGAYTGWLAGAVGPDGLVTGLDVSPAFLGLARDAAAGSCAGFVAADLARLPFADDTFDLVWCAQSLYSLPDPVRAVRLMKRMAKPGGTVAVLENDTLHHVLMPWPVEVELAVRHAEMIAFNEESNRPRKFYVGRRLNGVFRESGLLNVRTVSRAYNRSAPLGEAERGFLEKYLDDLRERTKPHLKARMFKRFERLTRPGSDQYLLDRSDLIVTFLDHVTTGTKPSA